MYNCEKSRFVILLWKRGCETIVSALKGSVPAREHLDPASYAQASGVEDRATQQVLLFVVFLLGQKTFGKMRREFFVDWWISLACE